MCIKNSFEKNPVLEKPSFDSTYVSPSYHITPGAYISYVLCIFMPTNLHYYSQGRLL